MGCGAGGFRQGEAQLEDGLALTALVGEVTRHEASKLPADGETQADTPWDPLTVGDPMVRVEDQVPLGGSDAGAIVDHGEVGGP